MLFLFSQQIFVYPNQYFHDSSPATLCSVHHITRLPHQVILRFFFSTPERIQAPLISPSCFHLTILFRFTFLTTRQWFFFLFVLDLWSPEPCPSARLKGLDSYSTFSSPHPGRFYSADQWHLDMLDSVISHILELNSFNLPNRVPSSQYPSASNPTQSKLLVTFFLGPHFPLWDFRFSFEVCYQAPKFY